MAWGRPYADTLVSLALPAILAPGNLPSLAAMMDCDLVIVTEQAFFAEIRDSVAFRRVQQCCPVRQPSGQRCAEHGHAPDRR